MLKSVAECVTEIGLNSFIFWPINRTNQTNRPNRQGQRANNVGGAPVGQGPVRQFRQQLQLEPCSKHGNGERPAKLNQLE